MRYLAGRKQQSLRLVLTLWVAGLGSSDQASPSDPLSTAAHWTLRTVCQGTENVVSATLTTRSLTDCASQCSLSALCTGFCFNAHSGRCYVRMAGASSMMSVEDSEGSSVDLSSILCSARCPTNLGYSSVNDQCVKGYNQLVTYDAAKNKCSQDGSHLYHFKSRSKDFPVVNSVAQAASLGMVQVWVGADSLNPDGRFQWSDGCSLEDTQSVWAGGQPTRTSDLKCVELLLDSGYLRNIMSWDINGYICQFHVLGSCAVCPLSPSLTKEKVVE